MNAARTVRLLADLGVLYRLPTTLTAEEEATMNPVDWDNLTMYGIEYMREHRHETEVAWKEQLTWATREVMKEKLKTTGDAELWGEVFEKAGW